jgi:hypothetical protein
MWGYHCVDPITVRIAALAADYGVTAMISKTAIGRSQWDLAANRRRSALRLACNLPGQRGGYKIITVAPVADPRPETAQA